MAPDAHTLAAAALEGPWRRDELTERLAPLPGWRGPEEVGDVVAALLGRWSAAPRIGRARLASRIRAVLASQPGYRSIVLDSPRPVWRWPVAPWADVDAVARGLDLRDGELAWFADPGGWLRRAAPGSPLHHYRRRWITSPSGTPRLLETPAPRLAELQQRMGRRVLAPIPVHPCAHGYVPGRSPHTLAVEHVGRAMVVRVDLEGFFSHVTGPRVAGLLRTAGYPPGVAAMLAGLLVTATPRSVLRAAPRTGPAQWQARRRLLERLAGPHLPQGAATSPAVANRLAYRLDRRLVGLAAAVGATYGRYADDLVFSGDGDLPVSGLLAQVEQIAAAEGFRVRPDKTRVLPAHHQQRVTGLVVNSSPAASRAEYDALRALLFNCTRTGPQAQNHTAHPAFRQYLLGRIAWVGRGRPRRVHKLRALFDRISWD